MINFRQHEFVRRELEALRRVMTDAEIRALVDVPPRWRRWLAFQGKEDPVFGRQVRAHLAYRRAMLLMMETE